MKFTGHQRDLANTTSQADDLDYMHARFYNPQTGRFLSSDHARSWSRRAPQSWNRYSYAYGNPLKYVDPDGQVGVIPQDAFESNAAFIEAMEGRLSGVPVIGGALSKAGGFLLRAYLPTSPQEYASMLTSDIASFGTVGIGGATGRLATRLDNIFSRNLTPATIQAAAREQAGQVVARKASGEAFDHIKKFTEAHEGAKSAVASLQRLLGDSRLTDAEHTHAKYLLSKYSKKLDEAEALLEKERRKAAAQ